MSFIPILPHRGKPRTKELVARIYKAKQGFRIFVTFTRPLMDRMNWTINDRVAIQIGQGTDAGSIMLTRVYTRRGSLRIMTNGNGGAIKFSIPNMPGPITREQIRDGIPFGAACAFEIVGNSLRIDTPKPRLRVVAGTSLVA